MLFNSLDFAIFLPLVFIIYWSLAYRNLKMRNLFLIIVSYIFYGWWDWRFLSLVFISTVVDYGVGIGLSKPNPKIIRIQLLSISLIINLGLLIFFKYFNFFVDSFHSAFSLFGYQIPTISLKVILPVGISFYTFQTLSYTIDVYRNSSHGTKDFLAFTAFVSFFPQLVAGPIERAPFLLPQFYKIEKFDYKAASNGLRQILWGLFKKMVIADNCAEFANMIFNNYTQYNGLTLFLGAIFFSFQIYADFSGYSDIAIGTSKLFGFKLSNNFLFPYFSRNIAEFWRRWHISLSTWFRDYVYIPLGGSKVNTWRKIRNTFVVFILSGFWHGANWTFIFWGLLHSLYFLPLLLTKNNRKYLDYPAKGKLLPNIKEFISIGFTFFITVIAWIFFRAENLNQAFLYISGIFNYSLFEVPNLHNITACIRLLIVLVFFIGFEWLGRANNYAIEKIELHFHPSIKYAFYYLLILLIIFYGGNEQQFIYFQF